MNEENKINIKKLMQEVKKELSPSKFDPNGSYTGLVADGENPIQDQDDL